MIAGLKILRHTTTINRDRPQSGLHKRAYNTKALFSLIRNRSFMNMHHNLISNIETNANLLFWKNECMYSADYNSLSSSTPITVNRIDYPFKLQADYAVDIIYYCDGLLCVCCGNKSVGGHEIHLWNPSTNEYKKVPAAPRNLFHRLHLGVYGFGYDNNIDTYKFVRVMDFNGNYRSNSSKVDIYTLGSNSWKSIQNIPYFFEYHYTYLQGVLYKGALHWHARSLDKHSNVLISFDITRESFGEVALPKEPLKDNKYDDVCTRVLGGRLCVLFHLGQKFFHRPRERPGFY
ncbi:F-box/kelch-repeat protein At3g06240-like [Papaver somniferum]|uniref:F-box/kelch-repeat protein At3g06240-like n=1 Tax=Papaver somniferum TaxID=3469 RepID=UPI000E6F7339|nr:F-box/kelch-repeat protein At3g06240-like [Papaver somniferum]